MSNMKLKTKLELLSLEALKAKAYVDDEYVKGMAINTDAQHLLKVAVENKILIGRTARGRGAGGDPEKGEQAA